MSEESWRRLLEPLLNRAGFDAGISEMRSLTGGVSSDIVHVVLTNGTQFCAKRALPKLRVASDWQAPLERNHFEIAWLRLAASVVPGSAPEVFAQDEVHGIALLAYLPPERFSPWKSELLAGRFDPRISTGVAHVLGTVHAATWRKPEIAKAFATDAIFDALRLDPYLRSLVVCRPDLGASILTVLATTASTRLALVHGDVSPKNILVSRDDGHPVLLDAECAWYGDPAFDTAFYLNHLLLKALHVPTIRNELVEAACQFVERWVEHLPVAERRAADQRVAALLPCLLLARVDGKSPVEYLSSESQDRVRALTGPLIAAPLRSTGALIEQVGARLNVDG